MEGGIEKGRNRETERERESVGREKERCLITRSVYKHC